MKNPCKQSKQRGISVRVCTKSSNSEASKDSMIDNIKMYAIGVSAIIAHEFAIVGRLKLFGIRDNQDGRIYKYERVFQNLKFTFMPNSDNRLQISNSLQKAATGNNYMPSKLSDLNLILESISMLTGISMDRFKITNMEVGFAFKVPFEIRSFLNNFSYYSTILPTPLKKGIRDYGLKYFLSEYSIKLYDKSWLVKQSGENIKISSNIIRVEVNLKKDKLHNIINSASMLTNENTLNSLYVTLKDMINKIAMLDDIDISHLNKNELMLYFAGGNIEYWNRMKSLNNDAQKYLRKKYRITLDSCIKKNHKQIFINQLEKAFQYFIYN